MTRHLARLVLTLVTAAALVAFGSPGNAAMSTKSDSQPAPAAARKIGPAIFLVPVAAAGVRVGIKVVVKAAGKKAAKKAAKKEVRRAGYKVRSTGKITKTKMRSYTRANMRHNLSVRTGLTRVGHDAHHIYPVKFERQFKRAGININDPKRGTWWCSRSHRKYAAAYNADWQKYFNKRAKKGKPPTKKSADKHATKMIRKYQRYFRCPGERHPSGGRVA